MAVVASLTLTLLIGFAAVGVDGSNLYRERGELQNAADLAALAAAFESCTGGTDPEAATAAGDQAIANG